MINKPQFIALICAVLLSASAGATSINGQFTQTSPGPQQGYGGASTMPLGDEDSDEEYPVPVFVRGSFNDWGTTDELIYQGGGIYEVIISLGIGGWEFKIASEDWSTVDLGSISEDPGVDLGIPLLIGEASFSNLFIDITTAGQYSFVLDTSIQPQRSLAFPLLTVSLFQTMPAPAPGTLALIGLGLLFFARKRRNR